MSITFPDWWKGGFPDRELVVMDLLQPYLNMLSPQGLACSWLPEDYGKKLPIVRVYRGGGSENYEIRSDPANVQLGVIGATRADSWAVVEYCRQIMLSYRHGGRVTREDGSTTIVQSIEEMTGPQQLPELSPDYRLVPITFQVNCKWPSGLPDYARVREDLNL
jgi:hypothetical protein